MTTREEGARLALTLPGVTKADHFDAPSFRVKGKAFAILREADRVTIKVDPEHQANLVLARPGAVEAVSGDGSGRRRPRRRAGAWCATRCATGRR